MSRQFSVFSALPLRWHYRWVGDNGGGGREWRTVFWESAVGGCETAPLARFPVAGLLPAILPPPEPRESVLFENMCGPDFQDCSIELCTHALYLSALPKRPAPQLPAFSTPREKYDVWLARERPGDHGLHRRNAGVREPVPVPPRPRHTAPNHMDRGNIIPAIIRFFRDIRHFSLSSKCRPRSLVTPQVRGDPRGATGGPGFFSRAFAKWQRGYVYILHRQLCEDDMRSPSCVYDGYATIFPLNGGMFPWKQFALLIEFDFRKDIFMKSKPMTELGSGD